MDLKNILKKIKLAISEEVAVEMKDFKTQDGIILSTDDLQVGNEVFVVDEAGKNLAPTGEYILEDGTKLAVTDGVIDVIELPEEPIEMPVDEMPVDPEVIPVMATELSIEDLAAKITKLEDDNVSMREILEQLAESFSKETFKEEVKMSSVEKPIKLSVEEPKIKLMNSVNGLNGIYKNINLLKKNK